MFGGKEKIDDDLETLENFFFLKFLCAYNGCVFLELFISVCNYGLRILVYRVSCYLIFLFLILSLRKREKEKGNNKKQMNVERWKWEV